MCGRRSGTSTPGSGRGQLWRNTFEASARTYGGFGADTEYEACAGLRDAYRPWSVSAWATYWPAGSRRRARVLTAAEGPKMLPDNSGRCPRIRGYGAFLGQSPFEGPLT
jgi:hypothetical protein